MEVIRSEVPTRLSLAICLVMESAAVAAANDGGSAPLEPSVLQALAFTAAFIVQYETLMTAIYYALCWATNLEPRRTTTDAPTWLAGRATGLCEYILFSVAVAMQISGVMTAMIVWTGLKVQLHWGLFGGEEETTAAERRRIEGIKHQHPSLSRIGRIRGVKRKYVALLCGASSLFFAMFVGRFARDDVGFFAEGKWYSPRLGMIHIAWVSVAAVLVAALLLGIAGFVRWRRLRQSAEPVLTTPSM